MLVASYERSSPKGQRGGRRVHRRQRGVRAPYWDSVWVERTFRNASIDGGESQLRVIHVITPSRHVRFASRADIRPGGSRVSSPSSRSRSNPERPMAGIPVGVARRWRRQGFPRCASAGLFHLQARRSSARAGPADTAYSRSDRSRPSAFQPARPAQRRPAMPATPSAAIAR